MDAFFFLQILRFRYKTERNNPYESFSSAPRLISNASVLLTFCTHALLSIRIRKASIKTNNNLVTSTRPPTAEFDSVTVIRLFLMPVRFRWRRKGESQRYVKRHFRACSCIPAFPRLVVVRTFNYHSSPPSFFCTPRISGQHMANVFLCVSWERRADCRGILPKYLKNTVSHPTHYLIEKKRERVFFLYFPC